MNKFTPPGNLKKINTTIAAPINAGLRIVLNVCGQNGKFDTAFDKLLTKRWSKVKEGYKEWYATQNNFKLGTFNTTSVASDTWVCNLLVRDKDDKIDAKILSSTMKKFADMAKYEKASIHISNILLENITELHSLMMKHFIDEGINVYVYSD